MLLEPIVRIWRVILHARKRAIYVRSSGLEMMSQPRALPGGMPMIRLNALRNAASDS